MGTSLNQNFKRLDEYQVTFNIFDISQSESSFSYQVTFKSFDISQSESSFSYQGCSKVLISTNHFRAFPIKEFLYTLQKSIKNEFELEWNFKSF